MLITLGEGAIKFDDADPIEATGQFEHSNGNTVLRVTIGQDSIVLTGTVTDDGFLVNPDHGGHEGLRQAFLGIPDGEPVPTQEDLDAFA